MKMKKMKIKNNKKAFSALLAVIILVSAASPAFAAAGSKSDPLISKSYLETITLPWFGSVLSSLPEKVREKLKELSASAAVTEKKESAFHDLLEGDSAELKTGGVFMLISGKAEISSLEGNAVNASEGSLAKKSTLSLNTRYIVCEDSSVTISILEDSRIYLSSGAVVREGDGLRSRFTDVNRKNWFFEPVVKACDMGLINGITPTTYEPAGLLTYAQAVKLAACMHRLYNNGSVDLSNAEAPAKWYESYISYAEANGIIAPGFVSSPDASVSRAEFVQIFYKALPTTEYALLNDIPDNAIPDVKTGDAGSAEIYSFYRAGILSGYTADASHEAYAFDPTSTISRAEVAAIMARMMDKSVRVAFKIQ